MHVLDNGGVVRGFRYWGTRTLPQRMRRQKQFFNYGEYVLPLLFLRQQTNEGFPSIECPPRWLTASRLNSYWFMHFDASPKTLKGLHTLLRKDPRVIRWTMLKEGEKLEDVVELKEQTVEHSSLFESANSASTSSSVSLVVFTKTHPVPRFPDIRNG